MAGAEIGLSCSHILLPTPSLTINLILAPVMRQLPVLLKVVEKANGWLSKAELTVRLLISPDKSRTNDASSTVSIMGIKMPDRMPDSG